MVYRLHIIIFLVLFVFSCSDTDLDKLSDTLTTNKEETNDNSISKINQQPIAIITADDNTTFRENTEITLDGKHSFDIDGDILFYVWKNGDVVIGKTQQIKVKLSSAVHIIELEVEDNQGSKGIVKYQINVGLDFKAIELDINSLEEIATVKIGTKNINQMSIRNNHLYAVSNDGNIYFLELTSNALVNPKHILVNKDYEIKTIVIKEDKLFIGSSDSSITIWDLKTKKLLKTIKNHTNSITSSISNNDIVAFSSIDKSITILSLKSNEIIKTIKEHKSSITSLEIIKNFLISHSSNKVIKIWDINRDYKNVSTIDLLNNRVDFMQRYKNKLITASRDGLIIIRDIITNVIIGELQIESIKAMSIYGSNIVVALDNKDINLINIDNLSNTNILKLEYKATSIHINEGIFAISLENQDVKIFGNKEKFKQR